MVNLRGGTALITLLAVTSLAGVVWVGRESVVNPTVLLCSDGRCGESSKLSRQGALRDLDMWADKEELKNKLDELQTVMDRGMSHHAASQQLNQYFDQLDHQVREQRQQALKQKMAEGAGFMKLAKASAAASSVSEGAVRDDTFSHGSDSHKSKEEDPNRELLKYFDEQDNQIRKENSMEHAGTSKLSAAAAEADLNAYFDSLPTSSRTGKVKKLEKEVSSLSAEVKKLNDPISDIRSTAEHTSKVISRLSEEDKQLMQDDQQHNKDISDAANKADQAEKDAEDASMKANSLKNTVVLATIQHKPGHGKPNPRIHMVGLPPGWAAYMDRNTKYTYFYNAQKKISSWDSPEGVPAQVQGLPQGWKAYKAQDTGKLYYVNRKDDKSTWDDPRVLAGAKVLALLNSVDEKRQLQHVKRVRASMLAARRADHGQYTHVYPRSQWADPTWMKFLTSSDGTSAGDSLLTNAQRLRRGLPGADHAMSERPESRHYDDGPRSGPPV